jgi:hypothetical protein
MGFKEAERRGGSVCTGCSFEFESCEVQLESSEVKDARD